MGSKEYALNSKIIYSKIKGIIKDGKVYSKHTRKRGVGVL